jgi:alpha-L-arabinofuranosidase
MRHHTSKHEMIDVILQGLHTLDLLSQQHGNNTEDQKVAFLNMIENNATISELIDILDEIKNRGLYVGYADQSPITPIDFTENIYDASMKMSQAINDLAKYLIKNKENPEGQFVLEFIYTFLTNEKMKDVMGW